MMTFTRKFRKKINGNVALETAIVLPIFLFLIFSILEFGLIMFVRSVLDGAVNESARYAMTGDNYVELQNLGADSEELNREEFIFNYVQERLSILPYDGAIELTTEKVGEIDIFNNSGQKVSTPLGGANDLIVYQVSYEWKILSPLIGAFIGHNGIYTITARTAIKNEDF